MSVSSLRFVLVSDLPLFLSFNFSLIDTEKKHEEKIQIFFLNNKLKKKERKQ